ncbi:MAG TPA: ABC transporter ATP-binding protein [Candidatus Baltobacteraceae bacterium]|nr:ABC transporter ATP-binding protein [Candidatus Baltobacteraceae bacterium]
MSALLAVEALGIRFGGISALDDVTFDVAEGCVTGLIGPNGAGKTTCFNCITRIYQPASGRVLFKGEDLLQCAPYDIARRRIARTFQHVELFDRMSVLDNVLVGYHARFRGAGGKGEAKARSAAGEVLDYLGLNAAVRRPARDLPLGTRKRIELARVLMAAPELILLDEPAAGLGAAEVDELEALIARIRRDLGTTILMVEHDMRLVMGICDRIVVLSSGKKIAEGSPAQIQGDRAVVDAYLGVE